MSEPVKRYSFKGAAGLYVYEGDFDALAQRCRELGIEASSLSGWLGDCNRERLAAQQECDALRAEVEALRAEKGRLLDKYDRDVYGLNNEGDPIGGDPAGGYANDNARLRAEVESLVRRLRIEQADTEKFADENDTLRAEVELLERIARHLVRVYVVDDQSYAPEAATDVALARYKEQFK